MAKPAGGKGSSMSKNRQPYSTKLTVPELSVAEPTEQYAGRRVSLSISTISWINPGETENFWLPVTRQGALESAQCFLRERFAWSL